MTRNTLGIRGAYVPISGEVLLRLLDGSRGYSKGDRGGSGRGRDDKNEEGEDEKGEDDKDDKAKDNDDNEGNDCSQLPCNWDLELLPISEYWDDPKALADFSKIDSIKYNMGFLNTNTDDRYDDDGGQRDGRVFSNFHNGSLDDRLLLIEETVRIAYLIKFYDAISHIERRITDRTKKNMVYFTDVSSLVDTIRAGILNGFFKNYKGSQEDAQALFIPLVKFVQSDLEDAALTVLRISPEKLRGLMTLREKRKSIVFPALMPRYLAVTVKTARLKAK
ncbi:hypothetical protein BGX27_006135 [Mortierella sp. AM989]|nr:hypothetical protein BGX27_006135 [Mortierella sp. AM989]